MDGAESEPASLSMGPVAHRWHGEAMRRQLKMIKIGQSPLRFGGADKDGPAQLA
jgi:hypothetical protein